MRHAGVWDVHQVANFASYGEVVRAGLDLIPATTGSEPDWVWLLHDDSSPDPHALEQLLTAASEHPETAIFGPKLREWPSLRRLIELGVTISGTGRRETGLERGEYDQGQHDERRVVLAVNTAGMLVRRDVLDQLGFDPELKFFGNDIDFGWRAARAGHSTMVIPEALRLPRRGGAPGPAQVPARGVPPSAGAAGGDLHAARERLRPRCAVPDPAAHARHPAAGARVPARARAVRGPGRARRPRLRRRPAGPAARRAAAAPGHQPPHRQGGPAPARPAVAALPARPGLRR